MKLVDFVLMALVVGCGDKSDSTHKVQPIATERKIEKSEHDAQAQPPGELIDCEQWGFQSRTLETVVLPTITKPDESVIGQLHFRESTVMGAFDRLFVHQGNSKTVIKSSSRTASVRLKSGVGVQEWILAGQRYLIDLPNSIDLDLIYDRRQGLAPQSKQYPCSSGLSNTTGCPQSYSDQLPTVKFVGPIGKDVLFFYARDGAKGSEVTLTLDVGETSDDYTLLPAMGMDYPAIGVGNCDYTLVQREGTDWIVGIGPKGNPKVEVVPRQRR